ncbi:MAG: sigma-54-dependent Fis family transcriptional regulator [Proteobacteria bacterium]|nr:sigma-54-dependent Fis family transcriptional regulator [Pseudomonadota bacterium]MCP4921403.1 sigma-54-dependent Fis family transcriptional regulator [Pseudomonadota bacterium]
MSHSILVVDDNRTAADGLATILRRHGHAARAVYGGDEAKDALDEGTFDVVLTDLKMEPVDGLDVLAHARALSTPPQVIVMTGYGTVDTAVQAMHLGASDFLTKPVAPSEILEKLAQLAGGGVTIRIQDGSSNAAETLRTAIGGVVAVDSTVLLLGEAGSGRNQLARQLHAEGSDPDSPFVVLSHPARAQPELLATAGTVFLPNVDLLDPTEQVQLVQLIDALPTDGPRLIASAAEDWPQTAQSDPRSQQLYYHLAVLVVGVPPLRQRPDDISDLLSAWIEARAAALSRPVVAPSDTQIRALTLHAWPGNLRELAAVAERAVVFGTSAFDIQARAPETSTSSLPDLIDGFSLQGHLEQVERTLLIRAIDQSDGDRTKMSRILGVERNTLRYKLNKYGLLDRT